MSDVVERLRTLPDLSRSPSDTAYLNPIQDAIQRGDVAKVVKLIGLLNPPPAYLHHQLFVAVAREDVAVARCLLEAGAEIDSRIVFTACYKVKSVDIFELLANFGWNINASFGSGLTALCYVIENEQLVQWLLDHGANPNIGRRDLLDPRFVFVTESGQVLNSAARAASKTIFDLLLHHGARRDLSLALHNAASGEWTNDKRIIMEELVHRHGVDINQLDKDMGPWSIGTPLFYAARSGNTEAVELLLTYGASPSVKDRSGRTAADMAERFGHKDLAGLLQKICVGGSPVADRAERHDDEGIIEQLERSGSKC